MTNLFEEMIEGLS